MKGISILVLLILFLFAQSNAQNNFGPYTSDANTVLLLHFDGDLSDASGTNADGITVGNVTFSDDAMYGKSVYLDNSGTFPNYQDLLSTYGTDTTADGRLKADSAYYAEAVPNDTSYIIIPANPALDLTGDWTIEGWIKNIDNQEWSTGGQIISKFDSAGQNANYFVQNFPGQFVAGYHEDNSAGEVKNFLVNTEGEQIAPVDSTEAPKEYRYGWLHFTFQHDSKNKWMALAIHNPDGELVSYTVHKILGNDYTKTIEWQQHPGNGVPFVEVGDSLVIGFGNNKSVHALLDEIRISNVVRPLDGVPPAMKSAEIWALQNFMPGLPPTKDVWGFGRIPNQDVNKTSYPIKFEILVIGKENGVASATIHYHTRKYPLDERVSMDDAGWQTVEMTQQADGITWMGEIPQQEFGTVVEYYITAESNDGVSNIRGINHDWWSHHYQGQGWVVQRGVPDTYYRFIVWKEKSLVLDLNMDDLQDDNVPADVSEWGVKTFIVGSYSLPDDVPEEGAAGESFSSLRLTEDEPGYLEILDTDHLHSQSYTISFWFKADTFNNAFMVAAQNGSRWEDQEPGFDEGWAQGFWQNVPGIDVRHPNNYFRHYCIRFADLPHPFVPQDIYNLETGKWYHAVCASDYTGDPNKDSVYVQVVDEDGTLWGRLTYPLHVPPGLMEGRFRVGHRGHPNLPFFSGNIDHLKMWNYYRSPEEDPALWSYATAIDESDISGVLYKFELYNNYPNPFNPKTTIKFSTPELQKIELTVYDILGKKVKTLISKKLPAGKYKTQWDGTNSTGNPVASGLYIYKLKGENRSITKKMLLVR